MLPLNSADKTSRFQRRVTPHRRSYSKTGKRCAGVWTRSVFRATRATAVLSFWSLETRSYLHVHNICISGKSLICTSCFLLGADVFTRRLPGTFIWVTQSAKPFPCKIHFWDFAADNICLPASMDDVGFDVEGSGLSPSKGLVWLRAGHRSGKTCWNLICLFSFFFLLFCCK